MDNARIDNTVRCIQRWTAMLAALAQSLDAERVAHWLGQVAAMGWAQAPAHRRLRVIQAWSGWSGLPLAALDLPASTLVLLTPASLAKVLISRALFSRGLALRRCIERERLDWFEQRVGPAVLEHVRQRAVTGLPMSLLPRDADQLAWIGDGWRRMQADGVWPDPCMAKLLALSLPLGAAQVAPVAADGQSAAFLQALPALLPELPCVCG
ncbi:type III secretion protein HrpB4 [Xanthomonas campestris pv. badrii]|uniref:Type III secretion protein HrpB4 n=1 Tax=Xanthomonas campestris pv. badrii TaxID=149696 RepID=A0A7Z2V754_XANCA|nr:type III secretion protein HrpB4 [Xanthomonas campestris]MCC4605756.1 type III secretion protein HrpB4 [Xanthomonas campestris pv. parthenii]QJD66351.1 type III secretion protein HrpB4 [Xanthomonas campestris pv. badrii]